LKAWAKLMGEDEIVDLLDETLEEEKQTDEKLNDLAETAINVEEHEAAGKEE
jgi:ferritin-like metal-binding protein YciE